MADTDNIVAKASQDLQTIEDFVNLPADNEVYPRLLPSVNVGTLAGVREAIFEAGGLPATPFATKALMEASELTDGDYAVVTDDSPVNNGVYVNDGGEWIESQYDFKKILSSIAITDTNNTSDIFNITDASGNTVVKTTTKGKHYFVGLDDDLKTELNSKSEHDRNDSQNIVRIKSADGVTTIRQSENGDIYIPTVGNLTEVVEYSKRIADAVEHSSSTVGYYMPSKGLDFQLAENTSPLVKLQTLLTPAEIDAMQVVDYTVGVLRIPSLIRIAKNKFLIPFEARVDWEDNGNVSTMTAIATVDPETQDFSISDVVAVQTSHPDPTDPNKLYTYMNPAAVLLDDGQTILMTYTRRYQLYEHGLMIVKSTDGGKSWSQPVEVSSQLHKPLNWNLLCTSSGGIVKQYGKNKGRVIMPAFTSGVGYENGRFRVGFIYSDDSGDTWHMGKFAGYGYATENQVIEDYNGDLIFNIRIENTQKPRAIARYSEILDKYIDIPVPHVLDTEPAQGGFAQAENRWDMSNPKILLSINKWGAKHQPERARRRGLLIGVSYDACNTWKVLDVTELDSDATGYTNIMPLDERHVLVVYEGAGTTIRSAVVSINSIINQ